MRILSMHVLKWGSSDSSFFICSAYQLGFVSWYQRPFFKQTVNFGARTASNRTKVGETAIIHLPDAQARCYICVAKNQIAYALLADDQYPERIAYMILKKMQTEFNIDFEHQKYLKMEKDENVNWEKLDKNIKNFQDPKNVDKMEKLKDQLKQVEEIVHKNMDDLMKRGEDLDKLMENSKDLNKMSLDFYKTAKKTNKRCCSLY